MPYDASGNWVPGGSSNWMSGGGYGGGTGQGDLGLGGYSGHIYKPDAGDFANPDDQKNKDLLAQYFNMLGGRQAPQAEAARLQSATTTAGANAGTGEGYGGATIDTTASNEGRKYQQGLLAQLQAESEGKGPSLATETMKQGLAANLQQQAGLAGGMGGGNNPALAMRNLQMGAASQNQQLLGQAGLARLQEQMAAQQQLGSMASGMRGQDIGLAEQQANLAQQAGMFSAGQRNQFSLANAGFTQQANLANMGALNQYGLAQGSMDQQAALANLQAKLGLMGMNQQGQTWALGQQLGMSEADRQAAMNYEQMMQSGSIAQQQMNAEQYLAKSQATSRLVGGMMSGIAGGMMSDARSKMEIESESSIGGGGTGGKPDLETAANLKQYIPDWVKLSPPDAKTEFLNESAVDDPGFGTTPDEQNFDNAVQKASYEQSIWHPETREPDYGDNPALSAIKTELGSQAGQRQPYSPEPWLGRAPQQTDVSKWFAGAQPDIAATNAAIAKMNSGMEDVEGEAIDEERKNRQKLFEKALASEKKPSGDGGGTDEGSKAFGSLLGAGIASSDERAKEAISSEGKGASKNLLDPIEPYSYRYKNPEQPGAAPGRQLGVMAQDVERSPYAMDAVIDTPQGKMINYAKLGPPMLAAEADLNKRVSLLEKMLAKRKAG